MAERYETIKKGLREIDDKRMERNAKRESIETSILMLKKSAALITEFDDELWNATIEAVVVHSGHEITFVFKDSTELKWNI